MKAGSSQKLPTSPCSIDELDKNQSGSFLLDSQMNNEVQSVGYIFYIIQTQVIIQGRLSALVLKSLRVWQKTIKVESSNNLGLNDCFQKNRQCHITVVVGKSEMNFFLGKSREC